MQNETEKEVYYFFRKIGQPINGQGFTARDGVAIKRYIDGEQELNVNGGGLELITFEVTNKQKIKKTIEVINS